LERVGTDRNIILKWIVNKYYGAWTGLVWLSTGAGGKRLLMW